MFAPMPSASESTAIADTVGVALRTRNADRKSCTRRIGHRQTYCTSILVQFVKTPPEPIRGFADRDSRIKRLVIQDQ